MAAVDRFLEPAAHDGRIALLHLARHHDAPEPRGRVRIKRKDEYARRPAVEPVHGPDPTAELLAHALHGKDRVAVGDLGAVHEKLLGLHHGTHHVIKIKDGKNGRNGLGLNGRFGFEGHHEVEEMASVDGTGAHHTQIRPLFGGIRRQNTPQDAQRRTFTCRHEAPVRDQHPAFICLRLRL